MAALAVGCPAPRARPSAPQPVASERRPPAPAPPRLPVDEPSISAPRPKRARLLASDACQTFARAYCGLAEKCTPDAMHFELGEREDCEERWGAYCTRATTLPGSGFTDANVLACTKGVEVKTCGGFRPLRDLVIPACHPKGKFANGAACLDDAQCSSSFCSHDPYARVSACGVCSPRGPSNATCWMGVPGTPRRGCPLGEVCSRGHCIGPMADEGEPCGVEAWTTDCYGDAPLADFPGGLGCTGPPPPNSDAYGTCQRYTFAEKCPKGFECEGLFAYCSDGVCRPRRLVAPGDRCDDGSDLCLAGRCVEGACIANPVVGDTCDEEHPCSFPFVCANGRCALDDPTCGAKRPNSR